MILETPAANATGAIRGRKQGQPHARDYLMIYHNQFANYFLESLVSMNRQTGGASLPCLLPDFKWLASHMKAESTYYVRVPWFN